MAVLGIPLLTVLLVLAVFVAVGLVAAVALPQLPIPQSQQHRRAGYLLTGPAAGRWAVAS